MQQPETVQIYRKALTCNAIEGTWFAQSYGLKFTPEGYPRPASYEIILPESSFFQDVFDLYQGHDPDAITRFIRDFDDSLNNELAFQASRWAKNIGVLELAHADRDLTSLPADIAKEWIHDACEVYGHMAIIPSRYDIEDIKAVEILIDELRQVWRDARDPDVVVEELVEDEVSTLDDGSFAHHQHDKQAAIRWAANYIADGYQSMIRVIDTETTGLSDDDEIVQIAILSYTGETLLDTLIKPTKPIPAGSTRIHGITDEMVADAPTFPEIYPKLDDLLRHNFWLIYNANYDTKILKQVCKLHDLEYPTPGDVDCAMLQYAAYRGEWNDYFGNWRWPKLSQAIAEFNIDLGDGKAHSAITDCQTTLALVKAMAAEYEPTDDDESISG